MTNPVWSVVCMMVVVAGTILCGIVEGASGVEITKLTTLMDFSISTTWFNNLWDMLWFNYAFFESSSALTIVRYCIFIPFSLGMIISFVVLMVASLSTFIQNIFGA